MLSQQKPRVEKLLLPLAKTFSGVNPNFLTLLGSIPSLVFFVSVINGWYAMAIVAFAGSIFDLIDGMIARKYNKVTAFGGFLDSVIDRIGDFLFITAFAFSEIVRWEIIAPLLLFAFLTSYMRSRGGLAGTNHDQFAVGIIERPERLIIILISLITHMVLPDINISEISITEWIFITLTFLSFITVIQRMVHAYKKL